VVCVQSAFIDGAVYLVPQVNWEEQIVLRKISCVAAVAAVLGMPVIAMAAGHGGMHMGGMGGMHMGGMHMGGMHTGGMHMGGMRMGGYPSVGAVQSFHSAGVFSGHHGFEGRHDFDGRHFHHHHHRFFVGGLGYYDDYGYGSCYRPVLTNWGWRYVWVCGGDDYGY
jgi:hypothetical protein